MPNQLIDEDEVSAAFWVEHPEFIGIDKVPAPSGHGYLYPATIRVAFSEFVDQLCRDGVISEELAFEVTLQE